MIRFCDGCGGKTSLGKELSFGTEAAPMFLCPNCLGADDELKLIVVMNELLDTFEGEE